MVPLAGIEPALLAETDFESVASTSSATGALGLANTAFGYHAARARVNSGARSRWRAPFMDF